MHKKVITEELIEKFIPLVGKNSYAEIAKMLGVSKAVVFKMSCITGVKPTKEQKDANKLRVQSYNPKVEMFLELVDTHSYSEIAEIMHVTVGNVKYFAIRAGYRRKKEDASEFLSRSVSKLNKKERRRMSFGLEQQTNKHLILNRELSIRKQKYRNGFRKYGYKVELGSNDVFVPQGLKRHELMEKNARSLGFKIYEI